MDYKDIVELANKLGIYSLDVKSLEEFESQSDGLSGGVSKLYSWFNKLISCHKAGVVHDYLYTIGGNTKNRRVADYLFCYSTALSGKFIPGWLEELFNSTNKYKLFLSRLLWWYPFIRLGWRCIRSYIMWIAVRIFGGNKKHFNWKDI